MIRPGHVLSCALLLAGVTGCKKSASAEKGSGGSAQAGLKASVGGKAMGPLYGIAQPNPGEGNSHRLTFSTRAIDCANFVKVMDGAGKGESFWIRAHEALRPDGSMAWAYGGIAYGHDGNGPSGLSAMTAYKVEGGRVSGTLPGDVDLELEGGNLTVTGDFSVPVCEPLKAPKLRHVADFKQPVVPIEAAGSTARVTVAGKSFAVKGATALRTVARDRWEIRLTEQPHGCSDEVLADLIVGIRLEGAETKLHLAGHWIPGSANVVPPDGTLKIDAVPGPGGVELTLAGAMDYVPDDQPYKLELSGTVKAAECMIP